MTKPSVSVALCTYNGVKYLQEQLDSIASQEMKVAEIVISDDGSSDSTSEVVAAFSRKHAALVRFRKNANRLGYTKNFEQAISLCRGDIIFLSDQDDFWFPNKVERVAHAFAHNKQCAVVAAGAIVADQNLNPTGKTLSLKQQGPPGERQTFSARCQQSFAYG